MMSWLNSTEREFGDFETTKPYQTLELQLDQPSVSDHVNERSASLVSHIPWHALSGSETELTNTGEYSQVSKNSEDKTDSSYVMVERIPYITLDAVDPFSPQVTRQTYKQVQGSIRHASNWPSRQGLQSESSASAAVLKRYVNELPEQNNSFPTKSENAHQTSSKKKLTETLSEVTNESSTVLPARRRTSATQNVPMPHEENVYSRKSKVIDHSSKNQTSETDIKFISNHHSNVNPQPILLQESDRSSHSLDQQPNIYSSQSFVPPHQAMVRDDFIKAETAGVCVSEKSHQANITIEANMNSSVHTFQPLQQLNLKTSNQMLRADTYLHIPPTQAKADLVQYNYSEATEGESYTLFYGNVKPSRSQVKSTSTRDLTQFSDASTQARVASVTKMNSSLNVHGGIDASTSTIRLTSRSNPAVQPEKRNSSTGKQQKDAFELETLRSSKLYPDSSPLGGLFSPMTNPYAQQMYGAAPNAYYGIGGGVAYHASPFGYPMPFAHPNFTQPVQHSEPQMRTSRRGHRDSMERMTERLHKRDSSGYKTAALGTPAEWYRDVESEHQRLGSRDSMNQSEERILYSRRSGYKTASPGTPAEWYREFDSESQLRSNEK